MRILFDHGTPRGIARALSAHTILTAYAQGWDRLNNGALLQAAEDAAVDVLLTTDQNIRYQQNLTGRKLALVVLTGTTKWTRYACIWTASPLPCMRRHPEAILKWTFPSPEAHARVTHQWIAARIVP
jgi:hypothetical protein